MTRTGTKWIAMAIVLVLTAGAWGERERERPERRSEGRSMADEPRGDRERQDREKQNRDRQRVEQEQRERRNRDRQRVEQEQREKQNRDRGRAQRDGRRRDEPRRGKPEVRIFRFEHIPAESFMEVLGQLSRRGPLGEMLSQVPIALHQHSNAVVVIGPPEAMGLFEQLANGLDAPSAFHERMARAKKPEASKKFDAHKKPGASKKFDAYKKPGASKKFDAYKKPGASKKFDAHKKPGASKKFDAHKKPGASKKFDAHKKPASKKPTHPKHPTPGKSPGGINEEAIIKAVGNPVGQILGKLLSEPAARELRLEKQQREAMHKIARQCGQRVGHMHQRVIQAIRGMNHEERAANARKIVSHARAEMGKMAGEIRKHVFGILKPEQRKAAARLLGTPGPAGNKGAKSKAGAKGKPTPTAAPRGCGGCGSRDVVLGDTGNCKTSDF